MRFITCGSVDDGKSTLIGRLLYDSKLIYEDQLAAIEKDSRKSGTQDSKLDLALLVDGLAAEREQGITIDVAYRFFSTDKRKFIVADTPGHIQYTRNMATGASTAQLAILLIDARHGVQEQTRRHAYITSLLGIRHIVVAVNKMDLIGFEQARYNEIEVAFRRFAKDLDFSQITCIPLSALNGDNVTLRSQNPNADWYQGPTLLEHLEEVQVADHQGDEAFRLPVQWVNRPDQNFRGYAGTIVSGEVQKDDPVIVMPSGKRSTLRSIETYDGERDQAGKSQAITLTLTDEIDISRGDVICDVENPIEQADQFQAHMIWMSEHELLPGRQYLFKFGNQSLLGSVSKIRHRVNIQNYSEQPARKLGLNEIGVCNLSLSRPIPFEPYSQNRQLGSFVVIDRQSNATIGAGMIDFALRRASNVVWQDLDVNKQARATQKHQQAAMLWFTGLSGCGKSTIANLVEKKLLDLGRHTYTLDGDNLRHGLNKDLGFTDADRVENIRRIGEVAKLMVDAGLLTLTAFISPFREERRMARNLVDENEFIEIFVDTPLEVCEEQDIKGLYAKARRGEIKNFTGIDSEYQTPENPEIHLDTTKISAQDAAEQIVAYLREHGYLNASE